MRWIQYTFLLLSCWAVCFIGARTMSTPVPGRLPDVYDAWEIGLEGKRLDWKLDAITLDELAAELGKRYGTEVEPHDSRVRMLHFDVSTTKDYRYSLRLRNVTLAEAILGAVVLDGDEPADVRLAYSVLGKTIVLRMDGFPMTGRVLRAYDIKPLIKQLVPHANQLEAILPPSPDEQRQRMSIHGSNSGFFAPEYDIGRAIQEHVWMVATNGGIMHGPDTVWRSGGVLFVETAPELQQEVVRSLNRLSREIESLGPPR